MSNLDHLPPALIDKPRKKVRALSLACGMALDFIALKIFFAKHQIDIEYIGIDIDTRAIQTAKTIYENFDEPEIKSAFIKMITDTIPTYLAPTGCLHASFYHQEEIMFFGNLTINNRTLFRGRRDKIVTNTEGILNDHGEQFIPEHFTWISQTPLHFDCRSNAVHKKELNVAGQCSSRLPAWLLLLPQQTTITTDLSYFFRFDFLG